MARTLSEPVDELERRGKQHDKQIKAIRNLAGGRPDRGVHRASTAQATGQLGRINHYPQANGHAKLQVDLQ